MSIEIINNFESLKINQDVILDIEDNLARYRYKKKEFRKILLIQPPNGDKKIFDPQMARDKKYENFPPYGLAVLAANLKKDYECKILNLNDVVIDAACKNNDLNFDYDSSVTNSINSLIEEFKPDLIALTCMFSQTHKSLINVAEYIKKNYSLPICAGGVHISNSFSNLKTRNDFVKDLSEIDFLFLLEAEIAFKNFLDFLNNKIEIDQLSQIFFNFEKNKYYFLKTTRPNIKKGNK